MNSLERATVSAIYPLSMVQIAAERGIAHEQILAGTGLTIEALQRPGARIGVLQQATIRNNLVQHARDPGIAIELGLRGNLTKIGLMGFGLMSCASFREVVELGIRYLPTLVPFFTLSLRVDGDVAIVEVREAFALGPFQQFAFDYAMTEIVEVARALGDATQTARASASLEVWLKSPEAPHYARFAQRLPRLRFGMSANQFRFDAALLDAPLRTANPLTAQMVIAQCEREMALLGYTGSTADRVRALLDARDGRYPDLARVAQQLHMSTRTLKRKLSEQHTRFGTLLDEVRQRDAQHLLMDAQRSVQDVALHLGYTDPSNFRRAFQRWTGESPTAWRERQATPGLPPSTERNDD